MRNEQIFRSGLPVCKYDECAYIYQWTFLMKLRLVKNKNSANKHPKPDRKIFWALLHVYSLLSAKSFGKRCFSCVELGRVKRIKIPTQFWNILNTWSCLLMRSWASHGSETLTYTKYRKIWERRNDNAMKRWIDEALKRFCGEIIMQWNNQEII